MLTLPRADAQHPGLGLNRCSYEACVSSESKGHTTAAPHDGPPYSLVAEVDWGSQHESSEHIAATWEGYPGRTRYESLEHG